jgi:hypothetical protein
MRFFELFFVPLRRESRETAHARQLMQASLLSLNRRLVSQKLRHGRQTTKDNSKDNIDYGNN